MGSVCHICSVGRHVLGLCSGQSAHRAILAQRCAHRTCIMRDHILGILTSSKYLIGPQTKATKSFMLTNTSRTLLYDSIASRNFRSLATFLFVLSVICVFWMLATVKRRSSRVVPVKLFCSPGVRRALKLLSSRSNIVAMPNREDPVISVKHRWPA